VALLDGAGKLASRIVREPLAQFLAIGLALFGLNFVIHGPDKTQPGQAITVSEGRVAQIAESYRLLAGRLPSRPELQALVDDFVTEEVDYREAVAMGLDAEDTIVRRRMRQKLEFLIQDAQAGEEPTEADLQAWLAAHPDKYALPGRIAFQQLLISRDRHGATTTAEAVRLQRALSGGASPEGRGDETMLPKLSPLTTQSGVAGLFGDDFAATLFRHPGADWFGPIPSAYGEHVVRITDREAGRPAVLADVRARLRDDWIEARRVEKLDQAQARLRERYTVTIDWPPGYDDPAAPAPTALPSTLFTPGSLPDE
jgi:hypothetical protein